MEDELLLSDEMIKKLSSTNKLIECPVCTNEMRPIFLNDHFTICKLKKIRATYDEVIDTNKSIEKENRSQYFKTLISKALEKISELDFDQIIMNLDLHFVPYSAYKDIAIVSSSSKLSNEYETVILLDVVDTQLKGCKTTIMTNFDQHIDVNNFNKDIIFLHLCKKDSFSSDVKAFYKSSDESHKRLLYFSDFNLINFISKTFYLPDNSYLIIIFIFIQISLLNSDYIPSISVNRKDLTVIENELLEYLIEFSYVSLME